MAIPQELFWLISADLSSCKIDWLINVEYYITFYAQIYAEISESLQNFLNECTSICIQDGRASISVILSEGKQKDIKILLADLMVDGRLANVIERVQKTGC